MYVDFGRRLLWQTLWTQMKFQIMRHFIGLQCLLSQNQSSEKEIQYFLKIITSDTSIYTMDHPDLTVSNFMGNTIGTKRVNVCFNLPYNIQGEVSAGNQPPYAGQS